MTGWSRTALARSCSSWNRCDFPGPHQLGKRNLAQGRGEDSWDWGLSIAASTCTPRPGAGVRIGESRCVLRPGTRGVV